MTVVRRELPRSDMDASWRPGSLSHSSLEGSPFDVGRSAHWVSVAQTKPVSSRATAVTTCCFGLPRAARREPLIAAIEALLGAPRLDPGGLWGARLSPAQLFTNEGMVAIVPRGFDEHASDMCIAGLGDRPARPPRPVPQQEFREPVAGAQQIGPNVFATPQQIADGLLRLGRDVDGHQRPGPVQHRELARVTPIRFNPITRAARDQGRRNDVARNARGRQCALQLEAARPAS